MGCYTELLGGPDIITGYLLRGKQEVREDMGCYASGFDGATSQGM